MRFHCKRCKVQATLNLVESKSKDKSKDYDIEVEVEDLYTVDGELDPDKYEFTKYTFKPNLYRQDVIKMYEPTHERRIVYKMNPNSITSDLTKFQGCCSYDYAHINCSCGELLGTAKDDCWQNTVAYLMKSKVFKVEL